jgi:polyamine oxidase
VVEYISRDLHLEYGFAVSSIEWSDDGVAIHSLDGKTVDARFAVLTVPVGILKSGSIRFTPQLPEDKRLALEGIVMGPVLKLLLLFESPFWRRDLSMLLCGSGPATLYWNVSYKAASQSPVLSAYCTGSRAAKLGRMSEEEAIEVVLTDLRRNFSRAKPRLKSWRRIDWGKDPLALGGYSFLRPGAIAARSRLAAATTGRLFWAGSETATRPIAATVEGAFTSGLRAAEEVLRAAVTRQPRARS